MHNKEYELKLQITEEEANIIKKLMQSVGNVTMSRQKDIYFCPANANVPEYMDKKCIRIRNEDHSTSFDFKELVDDSNILIQKLNEYSTVIENGQQLEEILEHIGLKKTIVVNKKRAKCNYRNICILALDDVDELGYFLEIELIDVEKKDSSLIECMQNIVRELGIQQIVVNKCGYSNMLLKKQYGESYGV